jgi:hypothetical protein
MNVSDQNFRRELTAVFVEMSEKISPALRDRVPASIAQARRERGGPYWIGALAASVIPALSRTRLSGGERLAGEPPRFARNLLATVSDSHLGSNRPDEN